MSHILVSMIGTHEDLDYIYETTDSSSETSAEQAFGYDYLSENEVPYYPDKEEIKSRNDIYWDGSKAKYKASNKNVIFWKEAGGFPLFTRKDEAAWELLNRVTTEILDLRFRDNWINVEWDYKNKRRKTEQEIHDYIKNLPEDITFFFGDAHL